MELTKEEKKILKAKPLVDSDKAKIKWPKTKKWKFPRKTTLGRPPKRYHPGTKEAREVLKNLGRNLKVCGNCGSTYKVQIHHKDGNPYNNDPNNLLILCWDCHQKEHHEEKLEVE